eukprot:gene17126-11728_t
MRLDPALVSGHDEATVFLNCTYGDPADPRGAAWTRVVLRVVRPQPSAMLVSRVELLEVRPAGHAAAQRWEQAGAGAAAPSAAVSAAGGMYLIALQPYRLRYLALDAGGAEILPAAGLGAWRVTAGVAGTYPAGTNKVLAVVRTRPGGPPAAANLRTSWRYATDEIADIAADTSADAAGWFIDFRVLSSHRCSRFNSPPGCVVWFEWRRASVPKGWPEGVAP